MSFASEFKAFALKGNVLDLAVAVVIGGAFGKIVSALVADIIMPLVGAVLPGQDWRTFEVTPLHLKLGDFLGTVVDFVLIALALFIVVHRIGSRIYTPDIEAVTTKACPACLETIPLGARLCRACRSEQI
jgi:large conductance mechanosensitive channel